MVGIVHARGRTLSINTLMQFMALDLQLGYSVFIKRLTIYFAFAMWISC